MALVYVGEVIVNTDHIITVRPLREPIFGRYDGKKCTHVVTLSDEAKKNPHTRDLFVDELDLRSLQEHMGLKVPESKKRRRAE